MFEERDTGLLQGMAADAEEAAKVAEQIGFPVVVKADAASVVHKSDMGGVAVDLQDAGAVREAAAGMHKNLAADDLRFFVQKYVPAGLEVIMGAKAEEGLGHMIMFGLGGIYVEIMQDVVFNLTPVTDAEAGDMLASIKKQDWNTYTITAKGNHLVQKINGFTTVDVTDNQSSSSRAKGILALQLHAGPPMLVQFKDIRLQEVE